MVIDVYLCYEDLQRLLIEIESYTNETCISLISRILVHTRRDCGTYNLGRMYHPQQARAVTADLTPASVQRSLLLRLQSPEDQIR